MGHPREQMQPIEMRIVEMFVTEGRLEKIRQKMKEDAPLRPERIPEYFGRAWFELIQDEMWNILKKFKQPTINFRSMHNFMISKIKELDDVFF